VEAWESVLTRGVLPQFDLGVLAEFYDRLGGPCRLSRGLTVEPRCTDMQEPASCGCQVATLVIIDVDRGRCNPAPVTKQEVEDGFAAVCRNAERLTGEEAAIRHFTNWWDEPRDLAALSETRRELRRAVRDHIEQRAAAAGVGGESNV
jgi:hypothetical protein